MLHVPQLVRTFLEGPDAPLIPSALLTQCQDPGDEFQRLFCRLCGRLSRLQQVAEGRCSALELCRPTVALLLLGKLSMRFRALLDKHKRKQLLVQFATKRSTLKELERLHAEVDALLAPLGLVDDWRTHWVEDREHMYDQFRSNVKNRRVAMRGLRNAQIIEVLAIIKYEVDFHQAEMPLEQALLMRNVFKKVVRDSRVKVPRIPKFFIAPVEIEIDKFVEIVKSCEVHRGVWDRETRLVAQYLSVDSSHARKLFLQATETWYGLEHENIVKMLGASHLDSNTFVVWEDAAAHGNFVNFFADGDNHEAHQRRLWRMFLQVAHGLNYMHQQGRVHGNLKCSHILVADGEIPKICHFELNREAATGAIDRWKSPEYNLDNGPDPSPAGDVYAFAMCVIEARTSETPYSTDGDDTIVDKLRHEECYPRPDGFRDDEWKVLKQLCAHNPANRPSMVQLVEMVEELAWKEAMNEEAASQQKSTCC